MSRKWLRDWTSTLFGYPVSRGAFLMAVACPPCTPQVAILNNQSTATANPHMQLIQIPQAYFQVKFNSSSSSQPPLYTTFSYNGITLPSWYEGFDGMYHYWWVRTGSIAANSYIALDINYASSSQLNGTTVGINPYYGATLGFTYGQYDNGANVFLLYLNGNTSASGFVTKPSSGYSMSVTNTTVAYPNGTSYPAIEVQGNQLGIAQYTSASITSQPVIVEDFAKPDGTGWDQASVGLANSISASALYVDFAGTQYASSLLSYGYANGATCCWSGVKNGGVAGSASASWHYWWLSYSGSSVNIYVGSSLYNALYSYNEPNYIPSTGSLYYTVEVYPPAGTNTYFYIGWARIRDYPPNGVMPSAITI